MTGPHEGACYADRAVQRTVGILHNRAIARDTFQLRFHCPEIARRITPGQFLMLRLHDTVDPLIGRPLALYDTVLDDDQQPIGIDVVYVVKGKFTKTLRHRDAGQLDVWGPLGNGFLPQPAEHLVLVAGGIGQTPFPALAREARGLRRYGNPPRTVATVGRVTLCYGARSADLHAGVDDFRELGVDVRLATDDGSAGHHGLVTELLDEVLAQQPPGESVRVACCGPEVMMEAVAALTQRRGIPCQVSLETPMACGIGICFTCVAAIREPDGSWDYRRTCVEGPVFNAADVVWQP